VICVFKLLHPYYSHAPPKFENVKKRAEVALQDLCGEVLIKELPHFSRTITSWVMPLEITTEGEPTRDALEAALERLGAVELVP